jgi:hypothetical protein
LNRRADEEDLLLFAKKAKEGAYSVYAGLRLAHPVKENSNG